MTYITYDKDQFSSQVCFVKMLARLVVWIALESLGEFDFSYLHSAYDDSEIKKNVYGIDKNASIVTFILAIHSSQVHVSESGVSWSSTRTNSSPVSLKSSALK